MSNFEYNTPIITSLRLGTPESSYIDAEDELVIGDDGKVVLTELPVKLNRVQVSGGGIAWVEIDKGPLTANQYKVDYNNKIITFHSSRIGTQLLFNYKGRGLIYVPATMIYTAQSGGIVTQTLDYFVEHAENFKYMGAFNSETTYSKFNIVSYNGSTYMYIGAYASTGIAPTDTLYWAKIAGFTNRGVYSSVTIYSVGDVVSDSNYYNFYQSLQDGNLNKPLSNTSYWTKLISVQNAIDTINTTNTNVTNAEGSRVTAENSRVSAENNRVSTESARASNESTRQGNETTRQGNESSRVTAESGRSMAETARVSTENSRVSAESNRATAESSRVTAENNRASIESSRVTAEGNRVSAEIARASAETTRQSNETTRQTNEAARDNGYNAFKLLEVYNSTHSYTQLNKVTYQGSTYQCIANTTGNAPTNTAYWVKIAGNTNRGVYSNATTYSAGDIVEDSVYHNVYQSLQDNNTNKALTNISYWQLIVSVDGAIDMINTTNTNVTSAENSRVTSENGRVSAENTRSGNESTRQGNESTRQTNESSRSSAESARSTTESNRISAETGRVTAESTRVGAESSRVTAETARSVAETGRVNAENARVSNETTRQSNETTRQSNETTRQNGYTAYTSLEAYNNSHSYVPLNKVTYNGSTYQCILASTSNLPTNTTYWTLIAAKGVDGSITSVTSANSDISVANSTTTPTLTLNVGTGANQIVKRNSSGDIIGNITGTAATVTNGSITDASIASNAQIDASKIANGAVSNTEFQHLDGISSNVQDQLNTKASTSSLSSVDEKIGNLSDLTTDNKYNMVAAISETDIRRKGLIININDYTSGGVRNNATQGLKDAISAALLKGGTIYFPSNTIYVTYETLVISPSDSSKIVNFYAPCGATIRSATPLTEIIRIENNAPPSTFAPFTTAFDGITFDGWSYADVAIKATNTYHPQIKNCRIYGTKNKGIDLDNCSEAQILYNLISAPNCINIYNGGNHYLSHNDLYPTTAGNGIYLSGYTGNTDITGNSVTCSENDGATIGVYLDGTVVVGGVDGLVGNITIRENDFYSTSIGIKSLGKVSNKTVSGVEIKGNRISTPYSTGTYKLLDIAYSYDFLIHHNMVNTFVNLNVHSMGVLSNCDYMRVTDNKTINVTSNALDVITCTESIFNNNEFHNYGKASTSNTGILLKGTSTRNELKNNRFRQDTTGYALTAIQETETSDYNIGQYNYIGSNVTGISYGGTNSFILREEFATAIPSSSTGFNVGDKVYNKAPSSGSYTGWILTGTGWKGFGVIA